MIEKIDCPSHLQSVKTGSIHSIAISNNEIVGTIYVDGTPNKKLLLKNETLDEIKSAWENDKIILLQFNCGSVRKDDVVVPNSINIQIVENENPTFM